MAKSEIDRKGNKRIVCKVCEAAGAPTYFHQLAVHLTSKHGISTDEYKAQYPSWPTISQYGSRRASEGQKRSEAPVSVSTSTQESDESMLSFGCATLSIREDVAADEQPLVPTHDEKFHIDEELLEEISLGLQQGENVLIVGPTGCGKTCTVEELGAIINQPVKVQNLRGDIRSSAFVGKTNVVVDSETGTAVTRFTDGILPRAMKRGWWLLLDELDAAPPSILFVLQRVLTHRQLILDEDGGRIIEAHPNFRIVATANTLGRGDDTGLYTGTNVLNEAFLDRFGTVIQQDYLGNGKHSGELSADDAEVVVVANKTALDVSTVKQLVTIARLVRKGFDNEECYCSFSTRRLLSWAKKAVALAGGRKVDTRHLYRAARLTFLNKLGKDDLEYVQQVMKRVIGSDTSSKKRGW